MATASNRADGQGALAPVFCSIADTVGEFPLEADRPELGQDGPGGEENPRNQTPQTNSPTVAYVADATPGLMKMGSSSGSPSDWRQVSGRRPLDQLRPRARPPVWPGRRPGSG